MASHPYRQIGYKPSYSKSDTAHYLSQHTRLERAKGLKPLVQLVGTSVVESNCDRYTTTTYLHRYKSSRSAVGFWTVKVLEVDYCRNSFCDTGGGSSSGGSTSGSGGTCPVKGTTCTITYYADGLPYDSGDVLEPGYCHRYFDSGWSFKECMLDYGNWSVEATTSYTYTSSTTVQPPPPSEDVYPLDAGSWTLKSDSCFAPGTSPATCTTGNSSPPPPPSPGTWGDCTKTYSMICNCPDQQEKQSALVSPYKSESVDRDWSSGNAGTRGLCKHEMASHLFLGVSFTKPQDRVPPKPPLNVVKDDGSGDVPEAVKDEQRKALEEMRRRHRDFQRQRAAGQGVQRSGDFGQQIGRQPTQEKWSKPLN